MTVQSTRIRITTIIISIVYNGLHHYQHHHRHLIYSNIPWEAVVVVLVMLIIVVAVVMVEATVVDIPLPPTNHPSTHHSSTPALPPALPRAIIFSLKVNVTLICMYKSYQCSRIPSFSLSSYSFSFLLSFYLPSLLLLLHSTRTIWSRRLALFHPHQ